MNYGALRPSQNVCALLIIKIQVLLKQSTLIYRNEKIVEAIRIWRAMTPPPPPSSTLCRNIALFCSMVATFALLFNHVNFAQLQATNETMQQKQQWLLSLNYRLKRTDEQNQWAVCRRWWWRIFFFLSRCGKKCSPFCLLFCVFVSFHFIFVSFRSCFFCVYCL